MANSFSDRASISSSRTKLSDRTFPEGTLISVSAVILSCGGADPEWEVYFDKPVNDLAKPGLPTMTPSSTGGTILRNTKLFCRITTVDVDGVEGTPSENLKSATTGSTTDTNKITISWSAVTSAVSYNVYLGSKPGMEGFVINVVGTSTIILDMPTSDNPYGIPTIPDIHVLGKKAGVEPIPLAGSGITLSNRLIVYVTVGAGADPAFSLISI